MAAARRFAFPLLSILAVLTACGGSTGDPASTAPSTSPPAVAAAGADDKALTVASWNLYLGAEVVPLLNAANEQEFLNAATFAWGMVVTNDFHVRARAVAAQIALSEPELIGLQEAYTWSYGTSPTEMQVVYDYVESVIGALAALGLDYRMVAETTLTDLEVPVVTSSDPLTLAYVRGTDHEVILARDDIRTRNPETHVFPDATLLTVSVLGQPSTVKRGWASVEAKPRQGPWLRFASTHLEAYDPYHRLLQAAYLAAALSTEDLPLVLVGDLNSDPLAPDAVDRLAYLTLVGSGLGDAWLLTHPGEPGFTSPFPENLTVENIPPLNERIDFVLFRGTYSPDAMTILGTDPSTRVCGANLVGTEVCLWPSDHAGLSASFRLANTWLFALGI